MEILNEAAFRKEIKGNPRTGYLFFGDEDYLKSHALKQAREALSPDPTYAFFNEMKLDAVDFEPARLIDALMPMPMMAERKLVTLSGLNFNTMRQNELEAFCDALSSLNEYDYNVLIVTVAADCFNAGYLPKSPSGTLTKLSEHLVPVHFERCSTAKLTAWIQKHFSHNGIEADPAFCSLFAEYCGHSMYILANEIDKLSFYCLSQQKSRATEADMKLCCTPALEYDAFAFTNAIMEGRNDAALAILADYRFRRIEPVIVLGDVTRVICDMIAIRSMTSEGTPNAEISSILRLHEFKVGLYQKCLRQTTDKRLRRALDACTAADQSIKSSSLAGYTLLEQLICNL
ncbi:MAG: DNA polymerase III subunit delta [Clostridia bacterium]|nr:DNA polymerase III subunit delta [Clostridia bacterium]MBQ9773577.1 DNA polymerase III subunit delta [Clostridia bacterium]